MANHNRQKNLFSYIKTGLRSLLLIKWINRPLIWFLKQTPLAKNFRARIPVRDQHAKFRLPNNDHINLFNAERCDVARELFWHNSQLQSPSDKLSLDIALTLAKGADIYLDVGAYTGLYAMAMSKLYPNLVSYAYEIVPENYAVLVSNIMRNNLIETVHPRICGIASEPGNMKIPYSVNDGVMASSVALDWDFTDGVNIPLDTIDNLHSDFKGKMAIKIDVEGFEADVLAGAKETIANFKPDIVCEVLTRATSMEAIQKQLGPLRYNFFHITNNGLKHSDTIKPKKHERDWLFTTRSEQELKALNIAFVN